VYTEMWLHCVWRNWRILQFSFENSVMFHVNDC
jgi:hypothetical protein